MNKIPLFCFHILFPQKIGGEDDEERNIFHIRADAG